MVQIFCLFSHFFHQIKTSVANWLSGLALVFGAGLLAIEICVLVVLLYCSSCAIAVACPEFGTFCAPHAALADTRHGA